jgi:hypothetical protein
MIATEREAWMRRWLVPLACAAACLAIAVAAHAQEGHPLSGTWAGDWGAGDKRTHVTIVMNWDGKAVTGTINPGPDAIPIGSVMLDVTKWTVRIEADGKDAAGKVTHISADGQLDDLGSYHRKITGTWTQGTTKGDFKITRD